MNFPVLPEVMKLAGPGAGSSCALTAYSTSFMCSTVTCMLILWRSGRVRRSVDLTLRNPPCIFRVLGNAERHLPVLVLRLNPHPAHIHGEIWYTARTTKVKAPVAVRRTLSRANRAATLKPLRLQWLGMLGLLRLWQLAISTTIISGLSEEFRVYT